MAYRRWGVDGSRWYIYWLDAGFGCEPMLATLIRRGGGYSSREQVEEVLEAEDQRAAWSALTQVACGDEDVATLRECAEEWLHDLDGEGA